ncbi:hypothetical protein EYS14_24310 [Alteromonadaceae bacterium M269]|nr:hypothetical protein EYS14_24310 [Alteromonadaceae bacterium M269]
MISRLSKAALAVVCLNSSIAIDYTANETYFDEEASFASSSIMLLRGMNWSSNTVHARDCRISAIECITVTPDGPFPVEPPEPIIPEDPPEDANQDPGSGGGSRRGGNTQPEPEQSPIPPNPELKACLEQSLFDQDEVCFPVALNSFIELVSTCSVFDFEDPCFERALDHQISLEEDCRNRKERDDAACRRNFG